MATRRLSPLFKLAFFTLLGLTILAFGGAVLYSILIPDPTTSQADVETKLFEAGTYTVTALAGLFGGKVA